MTVTLAGQSWTVKTADVMAFAEAHWKIDQYIVSKYSAAECDNAIAQYEHSVIETSAAVVALAAATGLGFEAIYVSLPGRTLAQVFTGLGLGAAYGEAFNIFAYQDWCEGQMNLFCSG